MKKILTLVAAAFIAVSASAQKQVITASKAFDNFYVGAKAGYQTPLCGEGSFSDIDPTFGIRIGKNFTTVFGIVLDADLLFNAHDKDSQYNHGKTAISSLNLNLLGTLNLMNLFGKYQGKPRLFEISALYGFGWATGFGFDQKVNAFTSKVALDFAFNLGDKKAWQIYIEPYLSYALATSGGFYGNGYTDPDPIQYDARRGNFGVAVGFNYKFKTSNGTHNFAFADLRDQAEIDGLNGKINSLRGELSGKDAEIARLKKALADCEAKPAPVPVVVEKKDPMQTNLMPKVIYKVGKSTIDGSQVANVEMIAKYMKNNPQATVLIKGYASPEGKPEANQILSEKRAESAKTMLVKKFGIPADRITTEGCGPTSELSDVLDFNRVATFSDTTKK
ncbi:MAG: OmpA family protein [Bacteroidaceae bacterium]|nr:OmpA family protein [Bacteroidaceae bacterium]